MPELHPDQAMTPSERIAWLERLGRLLDERKIDETEFLNLKADIFSADSQASLSGSPSAADFQATASRSPSAAVTGFRETATMNPALRNDELPGARTAVGAQVDVHRDPMESDRRSSRTRQIWAAVLLLVGASGFFVSTYVNGTAVGGLLNPLTYLAIWGFVLAVRTPE